MILTPAAVSFIQVHSQKDTLPIEKFTGQKGFALYDLLIGTF